MRDWTAKLRFGATRSASRRASSYRVSRSASAPHSAKRRCTGAMCRMKTGALRSNAPANAPNSIPASNSARSSSSHVTGGQGANRGRNSSSAKAAEAASQETSAASELFMCNFGVPVGFLVVGKLIVGRDGLREILPGGARGGVGPVHRAGGKLRRLGQVVFYLLNSQMQSLRHIFEQCAGDRTDPQQPTLQLVDDRLAQI